MQYALYLPNFGAEHNARGLADLAHEAEESGWDGFFLWDHIIAGEAGMPMLDVWVALAAMAMTTSRIRLGATVTPLPRRRPWKLARETVTLDYLSNGRLTLGVGLGVPEDYKPFGEDSDNKIRAAKLDEGLEILTGLWSGKPFEHHGQVYHIEKTTFSPPSLQQPRIPIWVWRRPWTSFARNAPATTRLTSPSSTGPTRPTQKLPPRKSLPTPKPGRLGGWKACTCSGTLSKDCASASAWDRRRVRDEFRVVF
jgi:hypothetical protein